MQPSTMISCYRLKLIECKIICHNVNVKRETGYSLYVLNIVQPEF
jgi:hypothetical protein